MAEMGQKSSCSCSSSNGGNSGQSDRSCRFASEEKPEEGKSKKKTATNVVEAIYDNGGKIVGKTPVMKALGVAGMHVASEYALIPITGKMRRSVTSIAQTLKMAGGKVIAPTFVAYNWAHTFISIFTKNYRKRNKVRKYKLK